ncbi:GNAT family N-acetyltransferase [Carboxylicivirga linearis]|uniref:GNAT family N-acetyltransferase n=1 Tax=Carboxylicivirga linearis TaxID=1628157 RepID=A0ABS5JUD0_9BACT|nr:GNAT family N-acetyltransferase [Carboxylicivirga linearis]MBS2098492.1 GNAT family N-acetyltransferase [Carboxylicivirga linearis]
MNPILSSERLLLKPVSEQHLATLLMIYNNKNNMSLIPNGHKQWTLEKLKVKYKSLKQTEGYGIFAILLKGNNQVIGEAGWFDSFNNKNEVELGYIIDEAFWNMGYGTEICNLLIKQGFNHGFKTIIARMYAQNTASVKLSEKCGMNRFSTFYDKKGNQAYEYRLDSPFI